jgi:uncharacterized repeat protein (TIGR01451 family)
MSTPTPRRYLLPISLASLLLAACGAAGYVAFTQFSGGEVAAEPKVVGDLNEGFAEADQTKASGATDRWVDVIPADPVPGPPADQPLATAPTPSEPLDPLPPLEAGLSDRYIQPAAASETVPLEPDASLPPLSSERYPSPAHSANIEQGSQEIDPATPLARGQTPTPSDLEPGSTQQPNPLRDSGETSSIPQSARDAFEAAGSLESAAQTAPLAAPPGGELSPNPLRGADPITPLEDANSVESDAPPAAQFDDARPLAATPAGNEQPLQPLNRYGDSTMASATPQPTPAAPLPYDTEPAPSDFGDGDEEQRGLARPESSSGFPSDSLPTEAAGRPGERALEGPQRPAIVLQKFAPPEIQIGKPAKFVIKVRNVGQRPAENVQITDDIPQGTEFTGATPQAEVAGGVLAWQLGNLSPGEERTVEVELMPTAEGEIGSVARVTFASQASAKTRCTRPQLALRLSAPAEVLVGRQQPVTIELHNPGTGDATSVMLVENVPDNVTHPAGPSLEFEVGTLRAGETRRMELMLTAEKAGHVVNVLTAQAEGNLHVKQKVEFNVIAPSLAVDIEGPARRYLERPATYTVTVDNPGSAAARDVQLVTKLPRAMQFVSANNLGEYDTASHSVYWSLAELPEGEKGVVELVTLPVQSGDHTLEVEGRAREGLQDRTSQQVTIEGLAAIMFEVADTADPIEVGGTTSYDIRVVNQGSKAASNVQVRVLVPSGMKVTGATGETRHSVEAEGVVFAPIPKLAPKADSVFRVQLEGTSPGDQRIAVELITDDITQPVRKEESTRVFGDE